MGIVLGLWVVALAPAGCSGSGDDDKSSNASQETVTVTVPTSEAKSKAKSKDAARAEDSPGKTEKDKPAAPDGSKGAVTKVAPAPEPDAGSKGSAGGVPAGEVEATNGSPPEVTLAVIDAESASVKKSRVHRYAVLLDDLERACSESRTQLAEAALTASHNTKGTQTPLSILDVLKAVANAHPSGVCADSFTRVAR